MFFFSAVLSVHDNIRNTKQSKLIRSDKIWSSALICFVLFTHGIHNKGLIMHLLFSYHPHIGMLRLKRLLTRAKSLRGNIKSAYISKLIQKTRFWSLDYDLPQCFAIKFRWKTKQPARVFIH